MNNDKERLEEAKKLIKHYHEQKRSNNVMLTERGVELIEHLYEQAERAQELEELLTQIKYDKEAHTALSEKYLKKQLQNKRYREALEFYADEETYETKFATDTDEICDSFTLIELDEGKKARKALEGEK